MTRFTFNNHEFYIPPELAEIIKLYVKRFEKNNDNLIILSGNTGTGKSNLATLICAYYSFLTGIPYDVNRVFFNSRAFVKEAISTKDKIFHYDESLFSSMAQDWQTKEQKELIKMLLLCRKKRHFYVFCIPDFFKLKDTIKEEKCTGLAHTYLRDGTTPGRFIFIKRKNREKLLTLYKRKNLKLYFKFKSFRGSFAKVLPKIIDEKIYDENKDKAILSLLDVKEEKKSKMDELKVKICGAYKSLNIKQKDFAQALKISPRVLRRWSVNEFNEDLDEVPNTNNVVTPKILENVVEQEE